MPLPRAVAHLNRLTANHVMRHVAPRTRRMGVIVHQGRRSGRTYRTPVNVFPEGDRVTIALTYGPQTEWVRNVLAAGQCELETGNTSIKLVNPHVVHDEQRAVVGPIARPILTLLHVSDFLETERAP